MYQVVAYASHSDADAGRIARRATFTRREDAMALRESMPFPIVDVNDIGEAGSCPRAAVSWDRGHAFEAIGRNEHAESIWRCGQCGAHADSIYIAGTLIPRPADR